MRVIQKSLSHASIQQCAYRFVTSSDRLIAKQACCDDQLDWVQWRVSAGDTMPLLLSIKSLVASWHMADVNYVQAS